MNGRVCHQYFSILASFVCVVDGNKGRVHGVDLPGCVY